MNCFELPFVEFNRIDAIAGYQLFEKRVCLNANFSLIRAIATEENIEENIENIMSHETIHGILWKVEGYNACNMFDNIDGWYNSYFISNHSSFQTPIGDNYD